MNKTSLNAYDSLKDKGLNPRESQIMAVFVDDSVVMTRRQLVTAAGMELSGVCGRVNALLAKNALAVRGHIKDQKTGNTVEVLGLPVPDQGALFGKVA
ncbi:hypothetical protein [Formosimonas limnophila]|nr:hypothetical protein [Formosimonas limnophila]